MSSLVLTASNLLLVLLTALLLLPSSNLHIFSGLPLDSLAEYVGFLALLPLITWPWLRNQWRDTVTGWPKHRLVIVMTLLSIGLTGKVALLSSGNYHGFAACYRSAHEAPRRGACENSYEDPFNRLAVTRIDPTLDFGPDDWNLSFMNDRRFNYSRVDGTIPRTRIPFSVHWRGAFATDAPQDLTFNYVGEARVFLGSRQVAELAPAYAGPATANVAVPPGRHLLAIAYTFDDEYRVGMPTGPGPRASFQVRRRTPQGTAPLHAVPPTTGWRVAGQLVDASAVMAGALLMFFYRGVMGRQWRLLLLFCAIGWIG